MMPLDCIEFVLKGVTWNMPIQRELLAIDAAGESLTGLALILAPGTTARFLFGAKPNVAGVMLGRVGGVALMAIGITCWGARRMCQN